MNQHQDITAGESQPEHNEVSPGFMPPDRFYGHSAPVVVLTAEAFAPKPGTPDSRFRTRCIDGRWVRCDWETGEVL